MTTQISASVAWYLSLSLLIPLFTTAGLQFFFEGNSYLKTWQSSVEVHSDKIRKGERKEPFAAIFKANRQLLAGMQQFEDRIEEQSWIRKWSAPHIRRAEVDWLGYGGEKVIIGTHPWLFYQPDVSFLTGAGFLDSDFQAERQQKGPQWEKLPQTDPVRAILHFKQALASRGIEMIVVPTPVKPSLYPHLLNPRFKAGDLPLRNASWGDFIMSLVNQGVAVFDAGPLLASAYEKDGIPRYLKTDTHWTPQGMALVARKLSEVIMSTVALDSNRKKVYRHASESVSAQGDMVAMLQLSNPGALFQKENVELQQVLLPDGRVWHAVSDADILLLGDSFSNIYSHQAMGWGFASGFAEQLSFFLNRPLDSIIRNDDGAFATRAQLSRELAAGRDRLAGKRLVIWQFANRELAIGDWRLIEMALGLAKPTAFFVPPAGGRILVEGIVEATSGVPKPGQTPYQDYILSLHVRQLMAVDGSTEHGQALVYTWGMRNGRWNKAAYLRPGQLVRMELEAWDQVGGKLERFNRGEIDNEELLLEPACWAEKIQVNDAQ